MSDRDYYEILGLTPRADGAMVDQAYWHLARKYQGLAVTNARAQYMLDELNEAYGVLGNPRLRAQYDAFRDDVLVRQGMIQPVRAKQEHRRTDKRTADHDPRPARSLNIQHLGLYALSAVICALAVVGAWQGLSLLLVAPVLLAGVAISVAPTAKSRIGAANLRMPAVSMPAMSVPSMSMPSIQAPKLAMPSLSDTPLGGPKDDGGMDADELRLSTAATIARWRKSVGLRQLEPRLLPQEAAPDTTLVDIVNDERDIDEASEPLNAVLDILRGSNRQIGSR